MKPPFKPLFKAFTMVLIIFFIFGFAYPTLSAAISEHILPVQSNGSQVKINGTVYGSYLLAEAFNSSIFFQPRPSAVNYNLTQSGGYPLSPDNPEMINITKNDLQKFMLENPGVNLSQVPYAMAAPSGSGLDPDIPVQGAFLQISSIAYSLHSFSESRLNSTGSTAVLGINATMSFLYYLVDHNERQNFPYFGSYYVNTVSLNFAIINMLMSRGIISQSFLD